MMTKSPLRNSRNNASERCCLIPYSVIVTLYLVVAQGVHAEEEFDASFLQGGTDSADLSRFSKGNSILPGRYLSDIYLNEVAVGREEVLFKVQPGMQNAEPCLSIELLDRFGIDTLQLQDVDIKDKHACVDLQTNIPSASVLFDPSELRLDLSIPQLSLRRNVRGYVDPSEWDRGVTAGMLNYGYTSYYSSAQQFGTQHFLSLDGGVNLGDWRLRSKSSLDWNDDNRNWENRALYAQRDIEPFSSQLTLGDSSTSGNIFDTFSLRGIQLASDERMLPDSQTGYAPVVRGVANSNAKVTIRQAGYTIYESTVASGPFEIDDLYPSGYGGDLEVIVTEANGQSRTFSVPYSAVVRMLRPGAHRYSAAIGQYRSGFYSSNDKPIVGQLTYEHGLSNLFTAYTGVLAADGYFSPLVGGAMNTGIGAFGLDIAHASTEVPTHEKIADNKTSSGQSVRLSFSKSLPKMGSSVSVAAYRYSTNGYYNLQDAMAVANDEHQVENNLFYFDDTINGLFYSSFDQGYWMMPKRQRSSIQVTLNQSLGSIGSLYFTGGTQDYWDNSNSTTQFQVGFSSSTRYFNYSIAAMRTSDEYGSDSDQIYATLSIPLGASVSATSNVNFSNENNSIRTAINGTSGKNNQYNWGSSISKEERNHNPSIDFYGNVHGSHGTLNGSVGYSSGYHQVSLGARGAVVAHAGGVTFGQQVSDTFGIIEAPDAVGASLSSYPGVTIDDDGYAIMPYLDPYRRNQIDIDPHNMSTEIELKSTSEQVTPSAGAVVIAKFETANKGRVVLIDLEFSEGISVPFGSEVIADNGNIVGIVGQGGRVLARGLDNSGTLMIKWGESSAQQCKINYAIELHNKEDKPTKFERLNTPCLQVK